MFRTETLWNSTTLDIRLHLSQIAQMFIRQRGARNALADLCWPACSLQNLVCAMRLKLDSTLFPGCLLFGLRVLLKPKSDCHVLWSYRFWSNCKGLDCANAFESARSQRFGSIMHSYPSLSFWVKALKYLLIELAWI